MSLVPRQSEGVNRSCAHASKLKRKMRIRRLVLVLEQGLARVLDGLHRAFEIECFAECDLTLRE